MPITVVDKDFLDLEHFIKKPKAVQDASDSKSSIQSF